MSLLPRHLLSATALVLLAACQRDVVAPVATGPAAVALAPSATPAHLLTTDEYIRILVDSTDARGNHVMVAEYPAGIETLADGSSRYVASIVVRSFMPAAPSGSSSGACITSTIDRMETLAGWTTSVKKPGGCDKEIVVALENRTTGQRSQFSLLYIPGKTRVDTGIVR